MNRSSHYSIGGWLCGFFIPILSFVYALLKPHDKNFKLLFVLFFVFVALALYYDSSSSSDIASYVSQFENARSLKDISLKDYFQSMPDKQQIDYYSSFMNWFVSRLTGNPRIYLGVLGLVYALFFAANAYYLVNNVKLSRFSILLLIVYVLTPRIFLLTHRWWTALQVFMIGLLPTLFEKKYWCLIWCFVAAVVFHFSFLYPFIILAISLVLPKRVLWVYLVLYIFSAFANSFDFHLFTPYVELLFSDLVVSRTESYISAEVVETNLFSQSARIAMNIANVLLCTIIYLTNKDGLMKDDSARRFYVIALLIGAFSTLASLSAWGWRYLDLSNMVFVAFYLVYLSNDAHYVKNLHLFQWCSPLFLYFIVFQIRGFLSVIGPKQFLFGNYLTTWFLNDTQSVLDLIKGLI